MSSSELITFPLNSLDSFLSSYFNTSNLLINLSLCSCSSCVCIRDSLNFSCKCFSNNSIFSLISLSSSINFCCNSFASSSDFPGLLINSIHRKLFF